MQPVIEIVLMWEGGAVPCHASVLGIANVAGPFCLSLSISFKPLSHVTKVHVSQRSKYLQPVDNWSGLNMDHRKSHFGQGSE